MSKQYLIFSGTISTKAVLEEKKRPVYCLYVNPAKRSRDISYIIALAKKQNIPVKYMDNAQMQQTAPGCGGIYLEAGNRQIPLLETQPAKGLCLYLDGVEDPYNMGSCARSAYAAGASMLVTRARDWKASEPTIVKASAGAWERLDIVFVQDDDSLTNWAGKNNVPILSAARNDSSVSLFSLTIPETVVMAVGGALRGLSAPILENSWKLAHIPYGREFRNALDTPSAAAVFAFEWTRQHQ